MSKGSDTRSSMLWQVERILEECKELKTLPSILLLENVPQVHSKKNMPDFQLWLDKLKELGYSNYYQDLNAKDYGIPQNRKRTFMVSILGDYYYEFPQPIKLEKRLKDLLESSVDEKYYLSDAIVSKLAFNKDTKLNETMGVDLCDTKSNFREISNTIKSRYDCGYEHFSPGPTGIAEPQLDIVAKEANGNNFNTIYGQDGISPTLLARDYKDPVRVAEINQIGQIYPNSGNPQARRIYDKEGLSPCLDTCQGGNREVKIVEENCSKLQKEVCNKAVNYMQPGDTIDYTYSNSRLKKMEQGYIKTKNSEDNTIMNTLTTNADAFGVCVEEPTIVEPRICASRGRNPDNPNSRKGKEHLEQRIELGPEGISNTLTTIQKDNYLVESQDNLKRQLCNKLIEPGKVSEGDIIRHSYTNSRFDSFHIENSENHDCCVTITTRSDCIGYVENQEQKTCPTLDTRCDCLGICVKDEPKVLGGIGEKKSNKGTQWYQQDRIYDDKVAISVTTAFNQFYKQNLRIRKLTPRECGRLQGLKDEDIDKIQQNQSNASCYHLYGDSICVPVLMAIFSKLIDKDYKDYLDFDTWWNI